MSEIHGAVGSYVVNALDGHELDEFDSHLTVCETCRREVVEFSETAAHLVNLVETPPPPALRSALLSAIREVRPLPPEEPEATSDSSARRRLAPRDQPDSERQDHLAGNGSFVPTVGPGVVDELAVRRSRRLTRMLAFAAAAALVVALSLGGWVINLRQDQQAQVAASQSEADLLTAPDARVVSSTLNGAQVSFVVSKQRNQALFLAHGLASPRPGRTYQLWVIAKEAEPDATIPSHGSVRQWFTGSIANAQALAVTNEPLGGSRQPSLPVLTKATL